MTATDVKNPRLEWAEYLRSPAELADRQVRAFPCDALDTLKAQLKLGEGDRLLNLGGGVGVLAEHIAATAEGLDVVLADTELEYLNADVPASLRYEATVRRCTVTYDDLGFAEDRFDTVVVNDLLGYYPRDERTDILDEIRRVLRSDGRLHVLEPLESTQWRPWGLELSEQEQNRREEFEKLRRKAHDAVGTRLFETFDNLPHWLEQRTFDVTRTGGWFLPDRLNDTRWTERQRTDLINLRHQARRDQVEILRQLLNAAELWTSEHGSMLRNVVSDFQQQALRKRKALESDQETGWTGLAMLLVEAKPA